MIKEIMLLGTILGFNASPMMQATETEMEFLNSTNYQFFVDEQQNILEPHSFGYFERLEDGDYTIYCLGNPTEQVYLWQNKVDNETYEPLTFLYNSYQNIYYCNIIVNDEGLNGIQLLTRKSLAGETYYIKNPDLSNLSDYNSGNILPSDSTALLYLNDNTTVSINSLKFNRYQIDKGITAYGDLIINDMTYIANNSITGKYPDTFTELNNQMLYKNRYTNKLMFTSGYYPTGYNTSGLGVMPTELTKEYQPYISFTAASDISISWEPLVTSVSLVGLSFDVINSLFGYVIFPGLTLGMLFLIPVILCITLTIIRIIKKGG